jgi:hypothetical protein
MVRTSQCTRKMLLAIEHKKSLQDRHTGDFTPEVYPPQEGAQALPGRSPHKFTPPDDLGIFDMPGVHKLFQRSAESRAR